MSQTTIVILLRRICLTIALVGMVPMGSVAFAAGGVLTVRAEEESDLSPTITRMELWRGQPNGKRPTGKSMPVRLTVPAGVGVVLDRNVDLSLSDGAYSFRMIRGPEYRIVSGTFSLEDTSDDAHAVQLPRMIDMLAKGWTSGDCCVVSSPNSLPLRMASEDLHMATTLGTIAAKPVPRRDKKDLIKNEPSWIVSQAHHVDGLIVYGQSDPGNKNDALPIQQVVASKNSDASVRVAIENPFAWPLPVWLASQKIDGVFLMGDWLRLDRRVLAIKNGRRPKASGGGGQAVGRWAEEIYRNILEAGFRMPPLAGGGSDSANTPVGYNRLYVGRPFADYQQETSDQDIERVTSPDEWWQHAWLGHSVVTNGPLLRPTIDDHVPGHVFECSAGETLTLQPALSLSTRDPVEYLEVIHNNRVHYSARLKQFAEAKGVIPEIVAKESGWVVIRVITLHEDHYRAAVSAPWYIEFDGQPRVARRSVEFFQQWLSDYESRLKRLPRAELQKHVPFVKAARKFWDERSQVAVD